MVIRSLLGLQNFISLPLVDRFCAADTRHVCVLIQGNISVNFGFQLFVRFSSDKVNISEIIYKNLGRFVCFDRLVSIVFCLKGDLIYLVFSYAGVAKFSLNALALTLMLIWFPY